MKSKLEKTRVILGWGVLAPAFGLFFDLGALDESSLRSHLVEVRLWSILYMLLLLLWSTRRWRSAIWSGVLLSGGLFATFIGLAILPVSIVGIFLFGVGLLGFIPFLTSWAYISAAIHAWPPNLEKKAQRWISFTITAVAVIATPSILCASSVPLRTEYNRASSAIRQGADPEQFSGSARLWIYARLGGLDDWVWKYASEKDPARRAKLKKVYEKLTGLNIDVRARELAD